VNTTTRETDHAELIVVDHGSRDRHMEEGQDLPGRFEDSRALFAGRRTRSGLTSSSATTPRSVPVFVPRRWTRPRASSCRMARPGLVHSTGRLSPAGIRFPRPQQINCVLKVNSLGCAPSIGYRGSRARARLLVLVRGATCLTRRCALCSRLKLRFGPYRGSILRATTLKHGPAVNSGGFGKRVRAAHGCASKRLNALSEAEGRSPGSFPSTDGSARGLPRRRIPGYEEEWTDAPSVRDLPTELVPRGFGPRESSVVASSDRQSIPKSQSRSSTWAGRSCLRLAQFFFASHSACNVWIFRPRGGGRSRASGLGDVIRDFPTDRDDVLAPAIAGDCRLAMAGPA